MASIISDQPPFGSGAAPCMSTRTAGATGMIGMIKTVGRGTSLSTLHFFCPPLSPLTRTCISHPHQPHSRRVEASQGAVTGNFCQKGVIAKAMAAVSRAAVRYDAFDRGGLGTTFDGPAAAAAHGTFKGQSGARGKNGRARMGAFSFFFLRSLFEGDSCELTFFFSFLQRIPVPRHARWLLSTHTMILRRAEGTSSRKHRW